MRKNIEVSVYKKIAEYNDNITDFHTDNLMEQILHQDNFNKAYKKVKANKEAGGVDGMSVDELLSFLRSNQKQLRQEIKDGKYKFDPVCREKYLKKKGEFRKLGVLTVVDRVIQQAIKQVLLSILEKQFSENSYGFHSCRGAHDALKQCQSNVNDGYAYVEDVDLKKFFDTVCQSKLVEILLRTIKVGQRISLIQKYLNAGIIRRRMFEKIEEGMPQGGLPSLFLSNIMLNELDKELTRGGRRFVYCADNCMILCKCRKSAERTLKNVIPFIKGKLFLKVNRDRRCANIRNGNWNCSGYFVF